MASVYSGTVRQYLKLHIQWHDLLTSNSVVVHLLTSNSALCCSAFQTSQKIYMLTVDLFAS